MFGGVDKQAVARGRAAIDRELESRLPALHAGGYVPMLDHLAPPDIAWSDFTYYRARLAELLAVRVPGEGT
jgi:hypothetical protein